MFSQLKKISDDRGILLLYLADELSPGDRQLIQQRLAVEAPLAAQLAELQAAHGAFMDAMNTLDAATPPPVPELAAMQRANRAIRQWATRKLAHPAPAEAPRPLIPQWWYPIAAAAMVIVAVTVWGVRHNEVYFEHHQLDDTPEVAIQNLNVDEQQGLVDAVVGSDAAGALSAQDQASQALASLQSTDDLSYFLNAGNDSSNREGTR